MAELKRQRVLGGVRQAGGQAGRLAKAAGPSRSPSDLACLATRFFRPWDAELDGQNSWVARFKVRLPGSSGKSGSTGNIRESKLDSDLVDMVYIRDREESEEKNVKLFCQNYLDIYTRTGPLLQSSDVPISHLKTLSIDVVQITMPRIKVNVDKSPSPML